MATDLVVPALGESISEAVIAKWLKQVGEPCATDDLVVQLETDKVTVDLPAPTGGMLTEQRFTVGSTVRVGQVIGVIEAGAAVSPAKSTAAKSAPVKTAAAVAAAAVAAAAVAAAAVAAPAPSAPTPHHGAPALSPTQRRALREQDGNVTASAPAAPAPAAPAPAAPAPAAAVKYAPVGDREELVPMTPLRKRVAERLVAAQHTAAILTTFNECDLTGVIALRERLGNDFMKKHGVKLGFMSFFVRATIEALREFPGLNAEVRGDSVLYKKYFDIGIAVGSGKGLVVPVVRDADRLSFAGIEQQIADYAQKARDNKLTLPEITGGTFTITNGGIYGSLMSTPLLNMPQTGILGMHKISRRPIAVGDKVEIRPMMYLALSYDHRLVDGREAVQFLIGVKDRIESPDRLLFGL